MTDFIVLHREILALVQQGVNVTIPLLRRTERTAASGGEKAFCNLFCFFNMKLPGLPVCAYTPIIINTVGGVGILLNFGYENALSNRREEIKKEVKPSIRERLAQNVAKIQREEAERRKLNKGESRSSDLEI